ncbi:MAG: DUF4282 domain-containing protein [Thermoleophilia bacterium]|nr:DUF4282 domain-containing protein [Thermoleophilia bacterium]
MADVARTCANCGNVQAVGDFCEKCGTRMPAASSVAAAAPAAGAAGAAAASTAARSSTPPPVGAPPATPPPTTPPPYGGQPQYGAPPQYAAPQYGYAQKREGWSKLFDFSFQGFVTPGTLKTLYIINLAAIGLFVLFHIIYVAMMGGRYAVIAFFIAMFTAVFWFFLSRIIFELMATAMHIRDKGDK